MQQLIFPFEATASYRPEDFLVSDCNRKAWMWMQPKQDWPQPVFILRGPKACGKTHLASIWSGMHNAPILPAQTLTEHTNPAECFAHSNQLVVEDIETSPSQTALFHLYNYAQQQQFSLLLTVNESACWDHFTLPDLRSRLQAAPQAPISQPDDMLLATLLIKHLRDHQLSWNDTLIAYLLPRLERSFHAAKEIVARLDESALRQKQPLTVPLARQILSEISAKD